MRKETPDTAGKIHGKQEQCPSCGYCPHCGRRDAAPYVPPSYPQPIYPYFDWTWRPYLGPWYSGTDTGSTFTFTGSDTAQ